MYQPHADDIFCGYADQKPDASGVYGNPVFHCISLHHLCRAAGNHRCHAMAGIRSCTPGKHRVPSAVSFQEKEMEEWHRDEPFESVIDEEDGTAVCHRTTFGSTVKYEILIISNMHSLT